MPARKQLVLISRLITLTEGQVTMPKCTVTQQRSTMSSTGLLNIPTSRGACQSHGGGKSHIHMDMGQTKYNLLINNFTESSIHIDSLVSNIGSCKVAIHLKLFVCNSSLPPSYHFQGFVGFFFRSLFLASKDINNDLDMLEILEAFL
jgi:hypothetical protein